MAEKLTVEQLRAEIYREVFNQEGLFLSTIPPKDLRQAGRELEIERLKIKAKIDAYNSFISQTFDNLRIEEK